MSSTFTELEYATKESERAYAVEAYFRARPQLPRETIEPWLCAGFDRGWDLRPDGDCKLALAWQSISTSDSTEPEPPRGSVHEALRLLLLYGEQSEVGFVVTASRLRDLIAYIREKH